MVRRSFFAWPNCQVPMRDEVIPNRTTTMMDKRAMATSISTRENELGRHGLPIGATSGKRLVIVKGGSNDHIGVGKLGLGPANCHLDLHDIG